MLPTTAWFAALAALASPAPPTTAPPTAAAPAPRPEEFRAARVEIVGFHEGAVMSALRLRLPRLPIDRHGGPPPTESPHVYLQIARTTDTSGTLRAITSDGREYERAFTIEIGQEVRAAASTAASLLFAVEEGTVAPDREDVAIPDAPPEPTPPEPTPTEPTPAEPLTHETGSKDQVPKTMPEPPARRWELAAALHGAALVGLGAPSFAGALVAGGGGLALELRSPGGGAAALELRGLGRADAGLGVGRLRVAVAGGYNLRRGRFELPVLVGLSVEPWWTTQAGAGAPVFAGSARTTRAPLLGGYLRVTPAARIALKNPRLIGLRVGPRLELGGSFAVVDGAPRVIGLADTAGDQRFRLGGLELSVGLELALQFAAP